MDLKDVRSFALRDWRRVEDSKRRYWADRLRSEGVLPLLEVAEELRQFVRSVQPDWPSSEQREADLRHHLILKELLDSVRDAPARG